MTDPTTVTLHAPTRLHQPWRTIARTMWVIYVAAMVLSSAAGLPGYYARLTQPSSLFLGLGWTQDTFAQALAALHMSTTVYVGLIVVPDLIRVSVFTVVGGLIFWRKSDEWLGLFASYVLIGIGWTIGGRLEWLDRLPLLWQQILSIPVYIIWPAFFIFLYLYPDGRFVPSWTRYLTIAWLIVGIFISIAYPNAEPPGWFTGLGFVLLAIGFIAQIYRYWRISGSIERLQTRWFLYSVVGLFGTLLVFQYFIGPNFQESGPDRLLYLLIDHGLQDILFILLPISIGVAILRYRLYDIDIIIRKTLIYSVLTTILGLIYFGGIIITQQFFRAATGEIPDVAIVASTLLIAALFSPLRRRIQNTIDRRFYRRKYDAEKTLANFSQSLRNEVDLETLKASLVDVVQETLQPACVALWINENEKTA